MQKENILNNLYLFWGTKPLDCTFNGKTVLFYKDLYYECITFTEYREYARNKSQEDNKYGI